MGLIVPLVSLVLGVVAIVSWRRNGQSISEGFGLRFGWWSLGDLLAGVLITTLAMVCIFGIELLLGGIRVVGTNVDAASLLNSVGFLGVGAVLEEVLFRMLLLSGLVVVLRGRTWLAILISAVVFGALHLGNPNASAVSAFGNALGGVIYGMAFLGGRTLWLPIGLHFAWNYAQGPILGFPVSGLDLGGIVQQEHVGPDVLTGGAYGPEAGLVGIIFRFVVMAAIIGYLRWRSGGRGSARTLDYPLWG